MKSLLQCLPLIFDLFFRLLLAGNEGEKYVLLGEREGVASRKQRKKNFCQKSEVVFDKKIWRFLDSAGANLRIHGALVEMIPLRSFQKILWCRFMAGFRFIPHHWVPDTLIWDGFG